MTKMNNPRICRACGKLIHDHSEQQIKECVHKQDKYRQQVGRIAFSECCKINPDNPQAVAESIKDMYEALKGIIARRMENHETEAAYIPSEIEAAYKALLKASGK